MKDDLYVVFVELGFFATDLLCLPNEVVNREDFALFGRQRQRAGPVLGPQ